MRFLDALGLDGNEEQTRRKAVVKMNKYSHMLTRKVAMLGKGLADLDLPVGGGISDDKELTDEGEEAIFGGVAGVRDTRVSPLGSKDGTPLSWPPSSPVERKAPGGPPTPSPQVQGDPAPTLPVAQGAAGGLNEGDNGLNSAYMRIYLTYTNLYGE